ncbi:uncharacterized protein FOMMEDRAFT_16998 [Fomitiporia mediterranea MF3/22]|uniref:uncharacterized protein n=1 Tax=Fomitiporia mediterranea (strain MF3/22) TaxID=694068 RepID=UPI0004407326|nr:uncharacterized protein FOMMEDRAFT_16998 [Fomitiporia mediterranea MF3/22]EJD06433.1 hypothetical protein FOMMEDRAFT_16998 [Fomitiporia mediterranea MF3/22]
MKAKQASPIAFFDDPSFAKAWSEIEVTLAITSANYKDDNETEIGWIEGRVHETRSTQKEVEILLARLPESNKQHDEAIRIFITCSQLSRFVFTIDQHIKISLKYARLVPELVSRGGPLLPFSLIFSSDMVMQVVRGGVCIPDGIVINTRQSQQHFGGCYCKEFMTGVPAPMTPPRTTKSVPYPTPAAYDQERSYSPSPTAANEVSLDDVDHFDVCPPLTTLTEGMTTPVVGIVEIVRPPTTAVSGDLCVTMTLADAYSYTSGRGFKLTCFTSKSRLGRELPGPSEGDVILFKCVKITKFSNGLIGTVYQNKLDWIVYNPETGTMATPRHAKGEPVDRFYEDLEKTRKMQFVKFIEDVVPGKTDGINASQIRT